MDKNRFERIYKQSGFAKSVEILVDKETGVNYLWIQSGYSGGLTPLLNRDGTPVISPVER